MTMAKPNKKLMSALVCIVISLVCVLIFALPVAVQNTLILSTDLKAQWQLWQLLSAHLTHSNLWHLGLNIAGLWLVWLLFWEVFELKAFLFTLLACSVGLSVALLSFTDATPYLGLSGTLHGLFAYALVRELPSKRPTTWLLIIAALFKLLYEQFGGSVASTEALIGIRVAIDGHLWGAVIGVACGCVYFLIPLIKKKVYQSD
jgi:rhomboid family GlyGly-CTERM serine protease